MKVNKFKKQLIAVGLSAVTAVTMVSTVFADEETTNPNTVDSTTQVQDVNETKKDDINSENLQNENNDTESTNDSNQEVVNDEAVGQSDESSDDENSDNADTDIKMTYTLVRYYYGENDYLPSKLENLTFEYAKNATEIEISSYVEQHYIPEGYKLLDATSKNHAIGTDSYMIKVRKNSGTVTEDAEKTFDYSKRIHFDVKYVDSETKEGIGSTTGDSVYREDGKLTELSAIEIGYLPNGYVFDGDIFKVTGSNNGVPVVTVYVKKGELNTKTKVKFTYVANENGTCKKLCSKEFYAQDYDTDSSGALLFNEYNTLTPSGYKIVGAYMDGYFGRSVEVNTWTLNYTSPNETFKYFSLGYNESEIVIYLEPLADLSTNESSDSKATLDDTQALTTLVDSLKGDLKKTYDNAINEGKKVEFVPTVTTANLDSKSEKAVKAEASKLGYSSVEVFDITLAMNIDGEQAGTITETTSPLTFKVTIPETLKKDGRKFYVLRYHDGEVTKLDVSEDGTFTTDKFSVYMLVYEDVKTTPADNKKGDSDKTETDSSKTNLISTKDNKKTTTDAKKSKSVNTSTRTNGSLFVGFSALALTGAAIVGVLKKKSGLD